MDMIVRHHVTLNLKWILFIIKENKDKECVLVYLITNGIIDLYFLSHELAINWPRGCNIFIYFALMDFLVQNPINLKSNWPGKLIGGDVVEVASLTVRPWLTMYIVVTKLCLWRCMALIMGIIIMPLVNISCRW